MNEIARPSGKTTNVWLFVIGTAALLIRFICLLMDTETLVTFLPDDSFYYFQLATNFINGNGTSVDGVHLTNGYHPLWMLVISPFFLLKEIDPIVPVKMVIVLSSFISVAVAYVVYRIIRTLTENRLLAIFGFLVYLFTRGIMYSDLIGEPSVLSNLLVAVGILAVARVAVSRAFSYKDAFFFGLVSGLAMLARTDNALFVLVFASLIFFWSSEKKRFLRLLVSGGVASLVVLPWLIWNLLSFGTIIQTSAYAIPLINRNQIIGDTKNLFELARIIYNNVSQAIYIEWLFNYFPLKYLLVFVIGSLFGAFTAPDSGKAKGATLILVSTATVFFIYFLHTGVTFYLRDWHCAAFAVITALIVVYAVYLYIRKPSSLRNAVIVISVIYVTIFAVRFPFLILRDSYDWQIEMYRGALYVLDHPDDKFAVYDGGIVNYFSDGAAFPIDGNINPDAHRAVVERRMFQYMKSNGVDYLIGYGDWNDKQYGPYWPNPFDEIFEEIPNGLDDPDVSFMGKYSVYRLK
ncbi:MAG: glycosyltransferase family 39 protein [bacterium]|nr:glycosyltransferase family 39 protein [bacterium]